MSESAVPVFAPDWLASNAKGRWLHGSHACNEIAIDTRTLGQGALYVALFGEKLDGHDYVVAAHKAGAGAALVAERSLPRVEADLQAASITMPLLVVEDGLAALQALGAAHRCRLNTTFVAVAGSNGKTTTKEMLASVLAQRGRTHRTTGNLNNHIGVPLSLLRMDSSFAFAVIEVGMNHPGELTLLGDILQPHHALLTNIQAEHLEGLGTLENVARAEGEIFAKVKPAGTVVWPVDEPLAAAHSRPQAGERDQHTFGESDAADVRLLSSLLDARGLHVASYRTKRGELVVTLPQVGKHNARNAAAAIAMGLTLGLSLEEIKRGLEATPLVDRRLNIHRTDKFTLIDDCYNANPGSMAAALEVLRGLGQGKRKVAVLGDMLELGDDAAAAHETLGRTVVEKGAQLLVVTGSHCRTVAEAALAAGLHPEAVAFAPALPPLLAWLKPRVQLNDVILVKGSRGMRLERVVEALLGKPTSQAGGH